MGKRFKVSVNGETFEVEISEISSQQIITQITEGSGKIEQPKDTGTQSKQIKEQEITAVSAETISAKPISSETADVSKNGTKIIAAPLPGKILSLTVKEGDTVKKGNLLLILEAMKMENEIFAAEQGKIHKIFVNPGDYVTTGQKLIELEK